MGKFDLRPGAHVHFMGICGTAMASLAGLMKDRGFKVTGSDQNVYPPMSTQLAQIGIPIMEGYKKENLQPRPDLVIVGNVISRGYEEAQALLETDIPYTSLPQAMGEIVIGNRHSIVVAGTHGKTTTTSMMAWVSLACGHRPGFMIGGIPKNFDKSYQLPEGDWFVIEGDEYDTAFFDKVPKFVHYKPRTAILTSIEFDHADIYKDLDAVKAAFVRLLQLIPPQGGLLVTNAEDDNIASILDHAKCKVVTFGLHKGDYRAKNITPNRGGVEFDVVVHGQVRGHLQVNLIGEYNIKNALAAFATAVELGWPLDQVTKAIAEFQGVKRRQEIIGTPNQITVIEDFAHHPTAVKATIQSVQARYPKGKVFSVFEARSATSRRNVFQDDYAEALSVSQVLLLPPAFNQTNIPEEQRFSTSRLVEDLKKRGTDVELCESVESIVDKIGSRAKPGDTVLIMSNGGFGGIYEKLLKRLEAK
ncbi:MAG: UDP-N-acetylmuramate:L-alanyl-gamma-D-glutamyl-meso-diaminopimelate ligase [Bdellovibrionaceae bacterium]|nr:UDP-N-acetylmuramate:L-alanyl-gamma-D-glutamyl-meso-diaminopimelate ligase [Pseudobdellovibrionaceae bacterium]